MKSLVKKYLPYAAVILVVFLIVPLFFTGKDKGGFTPVLYYFIFLITTVACATVFSAKNGLDFLFALIAPIAFLFTMFIYLGGFSLFSVILLVLYLVAGVFGLFLGDLVFGEERHKKEKQDQKKAEEVLLRAKRRDERESRRINRENAVASAPRAASESPQNEKSSEEVSAAVSAPSVDDDDFDYDKYMSDIDRLLEDEKH
ncbi:MAG TPA: hypothetical protein DEO32_04750 [Ruminococcaceae bacterium]|nr:hypothetical protein [Oscillospiraceae bacterium]